MQDKHLLANAFILFLCVIETPLVMLATGGYVQTSRLDVSSSSSAASEPSAWCIDDYGRSCELDMIFFYVLAALWLTINSWLTIRSWIAWTHSKSFMTEELVAQAIQNHQGDSAIRELKNVEKAKEASKRLASKRNMRVGWRSRESERAAKSSMQPKDEVLGPPSVVV